MISDKWGSETLHAKVTQWRHGTERVDIVFPNIINSYVDEGS